MCSMPAIDIDLIWALDWVYFCRYDVTNVALCHTPQHKIKSESEEWVWKERFALSQLLDKVSVGQLLNFFSMKVPLFMPG